MDNSDYSTWLEIDLEAIRNNIREAARITRRSICAVVKANGYGHGIVQTARAAIQAGATWCSVARIEEALVLRENGIECPVLVMGYTSPSRVVEAVRQNISLTVYDYGVASQYSQAALEAGGRVKVHLKVDSGMGRLGIFPEDGMDFARTLNGLPGIELEGLFTHFARADEPALGVTQKQIERFQSLVGDLERNGMRPKWVHSANSAGTLYFPNSYYDFVRCGIAMYGLHPSSDAPLPATFRPAMTWKARLVSVRTIPAGAGISYGHRYTTSNIERIGVLPIGYADGFRRRLGNFVLIHGERIPVVGTVCMDQCMVQLDTIPDAKIGDEVVIIGKQGNNHITAEEIGQAWGTINYEVTCGTAARVQRFYLNELAG